MSKHSPPPSRKSLKSLNPPSSPTPTQSLSITLLPHFFTILSYPPPLTSSHHTLIMNLMMQSSLRNPDLIVKNTPVFVINECDFLTIVCPTNLHAKYTDVMSDSYVPINSSLAAASSAASNTEDDGDGDGDDDGDDEKKQGNKVENGYRCLRITALPKITTNYTYAINKITELLTLLNVGLIIQTNHIFVKYFNVKKTIEVLSNNGVQVIQREISTPAKIKIECVLTNKEITVISEAKASTDLLKRSEFGKGAHWDSMRRSFGRRMSFGGKVSVPKSEVKSESTDKLLLPSVNQATSSSNVRSTNSTSPSNSAFGSSSFTGRRNSFNGAMNNQNAKDGNVMARFDKGAQEREKERDSVF